MSQRKVPIFSFLFASTLMTVPLAAVAQTGNNGGECSGGFCGTPDQTGGACGCGCGSVLIARTDMGDTYQFSDDYDNDGFEDDFDNCPFSANSDQIDADGDGIGDRCDICASASNASQEDADGDGVGDACDADADNDGFANAQDLCALVANPNQLDSDGDGRGNACDDDDDNDGIPDNADSCPLSADPASAQCDFDSDSDGIPDNVDNCLAVRNFDQTDMDDDKVGDLCDSDMDGDSIVNLQDNCARVQNPSLADGDRDGVGDACDDRFCFVVGEGSTDHCLDPNTTFTVLTLPEVTKTLGESTRLPIMANREDAAVRFVWTVINAPAGSDAQVENPRGSVTYSDAYEYRYLRDQVAQFEPDVAGEYTLQLSAELIFPDARYPNNNVSQTTMRLVAAENTEGSGCTCTTPTARSMVSQMAWLIGLAGALILARRRRSM